jgi:hypothetical protein
MIRIPLVSYASRENAEAARLALMNSDRYRIISYRDPLIRELRYVVIRKSLLEK